MIDHFGIAVAVCNVGQYGILSVFFECLSAIEGIRETDRKRFARGKAVRAACGSIVKQERRLFFGAETADVLRIVYAAARKHGAVFVGIKRLAEFFPMDQIFRARVPPVHIAPAHVVRIMLVKKMIFAASIDQPVRIVHPAAHRRIMQLRS